MHWLALQRYSLVFLKYLFGTATGLLSLNIVTYINVYIYTVLFLYFLNIHEKETSWKRDTLCGVVLISSPIFLEQYYFTLQSAEVSFGMVLLVISVITTYHMLSPRSGKTCRIFCAVISFVLLAFVFGIYQSFVNLYVIGVLICLYKLNDNTFRGNMLRIVSCIIVFALALTAFFIIAKYCIHYFDIKDSNYLSIQWFTQPFKEVLKNVIITIGWIVLGHGNVLNLAYTFCALFVFYQLFKDNFRINWRNFYLFALLAAPFLLNILTGANFVIRSLLGFPVLCAFLFWEFYDSSKILRTGLCITILSQVIHSELLLYGDYSRNQSDLAISQKILEDCNTDNPTIVFQGIEAAEENAFCFKGQAMGCSFYEWVPNEDKTNVDGNRIWCFMQTQGLTYTLPTPEQISLRDTIQFTAEYPHAGYLVQEGHVYYVNLGE